MKFSLKLAALLLLPTLALGQVTNNGAISGIGGAVTAAAVTAAFSGTCDASHYLRGDGSCATVSATVNSGSSSNITGLLSGNGSTLAAATGLPLSFSMGVSTNETTTGVADCATDVSADVNALVTAGYHKIIIPAGCIYYPTGGITPADTYIVGEDARSSVIAVASPHSNNVYVGAYGHIANIGVIDQFCYASADPVNTDKTCVLGTPGYYNQSSSTTLAALDPWQGQGLIANCGPNYTSPDGSASVANDTPCVSVTERGAGADGIYAASANTSGTGTSAIRIITNGISDNGFFCLNGIYDPVTNRHYCGWIEDYTDSATSVGLLISRYGDANGVSQSLTINDPNANYTSGSTPYITLNMAHQGSSYGLSVYEQTTAYSGNVLNFSMGNNTGTFTGNFANWTNGGTTEFKVDSAGNVSYHGSLTSSSTAADLLATGTAAQRPGSPGAGDCRYNSDYGFRECYNSTTSSWRPDGGVIAIPGCQGAISTPATHTGDTSETNLESCSIPAGMANIAGATVRITTTWYRNATTTDSVGFHVRLCATSVCTSGGLPVLNVSNANSGSVQSWWTGEFSVVNSTTVMNANAGGGQYGNSSSAPTTAANNMANAQVLSFNCANVTSSADTCGIYTWHAELIVP